jgi:hypothetical protein
MPIEAPAPGPVEEFVVALRVLHAQAGAPSTRSLATLTGTVSHTTVAEALAGRRLTSWPVVSRIVTALGGDQDQFRQLWQSASEAAQVQVADEEPKVTRPRPDILARLENDLLDRTVPLADVLRSCLVLSGHTNATQLRAFASAELQGYPGINDVPDYRKIAAPIMQVIDVPYRGQSTHPFNVHSLPDFAREYITEIVPLNQGADELEALASSYEAHNRQIELGVFAGDAYMSVWNKRPDRPYSIVAMYWTVTPAVIRGVLGRIRTMLTEFVADLRTEMGDSNMLPTATQTDSAVEAMAGSAVIYDSNVTFVAGSAGDIVTDQSRTTIKDNKTKIGDVQGNVAAGSADFNQIWNGALNVDQVRQFADLVSQLAPTLGLNPDQLAELQSGATELRAAADTSSPDRGLVQRAIDRVLRLLGLAASTAGRDVAIQMGNELGQMIMHQLPH